MTKKQKIQNLANRPGTEGERAAAEATLVKLNAAAKPMTANQITAALLVEIPKRFPDSICWRNNTGSGIGMGSVRAAIACLRRGDIKGALSHLQRPLSFGLVGSSDILAVMGPHGRMAGIEVKAEGDRQSSGQAAWAARVRALGGVYVIARDVEGCLKDLNELL